MRLIGLFVVLAVGMIVACAVVRPEAATYYIALLAWFGGISFWAMVGFLVRRHATR